MLSTFSILCLLRDSSTMAITISLEGSWYITSCILKLLQNSSTSAIFPTFSSLPTLNHISPLTNSSPHWTTTGTFPHLSPMPRSLRWNPVPLIDVLLCFTSLVSELSCPSTGPSVHWFPLLSHMLSSLESAAVPLLLHSTGPPFHSSFRLSPAFSLDSLSP